jgi:hypothetical protein
MISETDDGYLNHCIDCGRGMDWDLIWCSLCRPGHGPDRLPATPRKIPTPVDNDCLRGYLRFVARNHLGLAKSEGRSLDESQIYQAMLEAARHLYDLRQEFKIAAEHPELTDGTPAELRERLYRMIWSEARALARPASRTLG